MNFQNIPEFKTFDWKYYPSPEQNGLINYLWLSESWKQKINHRKEISLLYKLGILWFSSRWSTLFCDKCCQSENESKNRTIQRLAEKSLKEGDTNQISLVMLWQEPNSQGLTFLLSQLRSDCIYHNFPSYIFSGMAREEDFY